MRRNRSHAVCFLRGGNCELNWATRCSMARCAGKADAWSGHWRYQVFHNNCAPVWSMRSSCASSQVRPASPGFRPIRSANPANATVLQRLSMPAAQQTHLYPICQRLVVMRGRESSMALEVVVRSVGGGARMVQAQ